MVGKRTRAIQRKLKGVEVLNEEETTNVTGVAVLVNEEELGKEVG